MPPGPIPERHPHAKKDRADEWLKNPTGRGKCPDPGDRRDVGATSTAVSVAPAGLVVYLLVRQHSTAVHERHRRQQEMDQDREGGAEAFSHSWDPLGMVDGTQGRRGRLAGDCQDCQRGKV